MKTLINRFKTTYKNMYFCMSLIMKANPKSFVILSVLVLVMSITPIGVSFLTKVILDAVQEWFFCERFHFVILLVLIAAYAIASCMNSVVVFWTQKRSVIQIQNLLMYLNKGVMKKAVLLDVSSFDIPQEYEKFRRGKNNVVDFQQIVFGSVRAMCSLLSLLISFTIIMFYNPLIILLLALCCMMKAFWEKRRREKEYQYQKEIALDEKRKNYYFDLLFRKKTAIEMKYYGIDEIIFERYVKALKELNDRGNRFGTRNNGFSLLADLPEKALQAFVGIKLILDVVVRKLTVGDYSYYMGVFETLITSANEIAENLAIYNAYDEKIKEYKAFFGDEEENARSGEKIDKIDSITFEHVSFTYPGNDAEALSDVSFSLHSGENVFLVGCNGSGKSTIVKLLCGFYEPSKGEILINDRPIREIDIMSLRKQISATFQDFVTYALSLRENVIFSDQKDPAVDAEIAKALSEAELKAEDETDFSLDTYVSKEFDEKGIEFSGGQKQKIAVARALYRKSSLRLMDEPTASLDPYAESEIFRGLNQKTGDLISIIVSHCLAGATTADKVIFLNNGKLVGLGTHKELMESIDEYREFYHLQKEHYV